MKFEVIENGLYRLDVDKTPIEIGTKLSLVQLIHGVDGKDCGICINKECPEGATTVNDCVVRCFLPSGCLREVK